MANLLELKLAALRALGRHVHVRGRDRVIRWFEGPERLRDYPFEVEFHGLRYPGNLKRFIDWCVFFYGGYSGHELAVLGDVVGEVRRHRAGPLVAWDVGANVGQHSLLLSAIADQIFCFEPLTLHAALIREKLAFNGIDTSCVREVALGDVAGEMTIYHPDPDRTGNLCTASLRKDFNPGNNTLKSVIKVVVGDAYRAEHDLPPPDIFKLDVEGFEHQALRGLSETIFAAAPVILMESTPQTWESYPTEDALRAMFPPSCFLELTATARPDG